MWPKRRTAKARANSLGRLVDDEDYTIWMFFHIKMWVFLKLESRVHHRWRRTWVCKNVASDEKTTSQEGKETKVGCRIKYMKFQNWELTFFMFDSVGTVLPKQKIHTLLLASQPATNVQLVVFWVTDLCFSSFDTRFMKLNKFWPLSPCLFSVSFSPWIFLHINVWSPPKSI